MAGLWFLVALLLLWGAHASCTISSLWTCNFGASEICLGIEGSALASACQNKIFRIDGTLELISPLHLSHVESFEMGNGSYFRCASAGCELNITSRSIEIEGTVDFTEIEVTSGTNLNVTEFGNLTATNIQLTARDHIAVGGLLAADDIRLNSFGNITIAPGGLVSVTGRGLQNQVHSGAPQSLGDGAVQCVLHTQGSMQNPSFAGEAGASNGSGVGGGGAVFMEACDMLIVDGSAEANGGIGRSDRRRRTPSVPAMDGGSGGSIWINAASIRGTGSLSAKGVCGYIQETNTSAPRYCGGGGRIAMHTSNGEGAAVAVNVEGGRTHGMECPRGSKFVGISPTFDSCNVAPPPLPCLTSIVELQGQLVQTPWLAVGSSERIACPEGSIGSFVVSCDAGAVRIVQDNCSNYTCGLQNRRLFANESIFWSEALVAAGDCGGPFLPGNVVPVPCPWPYKGVARLWCSDGDYETDMVDTCRRPTTTSSSVSSLTTATSSATSKSSALSNTSTTSTSTTSSHTTSSVSSSSSTSSRTTNTATTSSKSSLLSTSTTSSQTATSSSSTSTASSKPSSPSSTSTTSSQTTTTASSTSQTSSSTTATSTTSSESSSSTTTTPTSTSSGPNQLRKATSTVGSTSIMSYPGMLTELAALVPLVPLVLSCLA